MFGEFITPPMKFYETQKRMDLNDLQGTRVDIAGGYSQKSGKLDHYAAGALYAQDGAFDSLERAVDDADLLSFAELVGYVLEVEGVVGHDSADLHEVFHGLVGDDDRLTGAFVPHEMSGAVLPHPVEKVFDERFGRTHKAEVRHRRSGHGNGLAVLDHFLAGHRHKMLDTKLLKSGAELQGPSVGHPYRVPFCCHVEMGGLEPPSKHRTRELSTRLVYLWFSSHGCRETGHRTLIL